MCAVEDVNAFPYESITNIIGLKVIPGKEKNIREYSAHFHEITHIFKAFGCFDVIFFLSIEEEALSLFIKKIEQIEGVLEVHIMKLI